MQMTSGFGFRRPLVLTAHVIAVCVALAAGLVLASRLSNTQFLSQIRLREVSPAAALGFLLAAISLFLAKYSESRIVQNIGRVTALLVLCVGLFGLASQTGASRSITTLPGATIFNPFRRMIDGTAVGFIVLGVSLFANFGSRRSRIIAQGTAIVLGGATILSLLGTGNWGSSTRIDPTSTVAFVSFAVGVLCSRPTDGVMTALTDESAGGVVFRRLVLGLIPIAIAVAWLGAARNTASSGYRQAWEMILIATVLVFFGLMWRCSRTLHTRDSENNKAIEALKLSTQDLQEQLHGRTQSLVAVNELLATSAARLENAEFDLDRNRRELSDLVDSEVVGLHWVGSDGLILRANNTDLRLLGYSREEYVGHHIAEFYADEEIIEDVLQKIRRAEKIESYEARMRAKDGSIRYVQINPTILLEQDKLVHAVFFTTDVTERKRFEQELAHMLAREHALRGLAEEAESRYHDLVHGVDAIVWEADLDYFQFSFVNRRAEAILGYPVARWREPGFWLSLIHPDDRDRSAELYQRATAERRDHEFEHRAIAADGRVVWLHDKIYIVAGKDGKPQLRGLMMDITARKQAEEERAELLVRERAARAEAERAADMVRRLQVVADIALSHLSLEDLLRGMLTRIRELLKADSAAVLLVTQDGENLSARATVGWENEFTAASSIPMGSDVVGRIASERTPLVVNDLSVIEQTPSNLPSKARSLVGAPLLIGQRVIGVIHASSVGVGAFVEDDVKLLQLAADRVALAIERAQLYEAEQRARLEAERASQMKDEFLATLSHELRSPLNAILGWVVLMRQGKLDSNDSARALETVERSARSQNRMINDLLDVSRIISGRLRLNVRSVKPAQIVDAAVDALRPAATAKAINLDVKLDTDAGTITADSDRLQRIVWNLISNAIRFTPKGGQIEVQLTQVDSRIEIAVRDTGIGINPAFLPYVFDRFRQADSSSKRRQGGLGLGLAIVRHLVEMHGGTVKAESNGEGKGATFVVELPLGAAGVEHEASPEMEHLAVSADRLIADPSALQLNGVRVLVVDDEARARELVASILTRGDVEVRAADSMSEALTVLNEWIPDLIISDIEMPGADGYSLIRRVRSLPKQRGRDIPAIALTAYARSEDRMRAFAAGFQMHIPKPVEPDQLLTSVASLTGRLASEPEKSIERGIGNGNVQGNSTSGAA